MSDVDDEFDFNDDDEEISDDEEEDAIMPSDGNLKPKKGTVDISDVLLLGEVDRDEALDNEEDEELDGEDAEEDDVDEINANDDDSAATARYIADTKNRSKFVRAVPDDDRITDDHMDEFEYTGAISFRIAHLVEGATPFTDVTGLTNPRHIAIKELIDGKSPFIVERHIKETETEIIVERWTANELKCHHHIQEAIPLTNKQIEEKLAMV